MPRRAAAQAAASSRRGDFLERADNVLAFGLPGVGKSHAACAARPRAGRGGPSRALHADLPARAGAARGASATCSLPRALRKLDVFDVVILDDLGYVQQTPEEVEVLFTLMAERYERRSVLITSNLVFSEWDRIFKNPMTTAAAIDRLVHHAVHPRVRRPELSHRSVTAIAAGASVRRRLRRGRRPGPLLSKRRR